MYTTIVTSAIIIFGSAYIGVAYASKYEIALRQISAFINAFKMLEFDISFLKLPLSESFARISKSQNGAVKKIFEFMAKELSENKTDNAGELFKKSIEKYSKELLFDEEVKKTLFDFSKNMGCMDAENEITNIKATHIKLKYFEDEARESARKNVKMCRGLGLLTGIFIVIVLC